MRAVIALALLLSACSSIEFDELASTGTTALATSVASAVGAPPAVSLVVGTGTGIATAAATPPSADPVDPVNYQGEDMQWQFTELLAFAWATFSQQLIGLGVVAGVIWLLTVYMGLRTPRGEERAMNRQQRMLLDKVGKMKE